jgi:hypothetical protein
MTLESGRMSTRLERPRPRTRYTLDRARAIVQDPEWYEELEDYEQGDVLYVLKEWKRTWADRVGCKAKAPKAPNPKQSGH